VSRGESGYPGKVREIPVVPFFPLQPAGDGHGEQGRAPGRQVVLPGAGALPESMLPALPLVVLLILMYQTQ